MEGQKIFKVQIRFNGSSTFEYLSNQAEVGMAIACAVRKLYVKNIAINPVESRIDEVSTTRLSRSEVIDENIISEG